VLPNGSVLASMANAQIVRFDPPNFDAVISEFNDGHRFTDAWTGFADDPSGQVWAVGSGGWIASRALDAGWRLLSNNASDTDTFFNLESVWAPDNDDAYAVGLQRLYVRTNGVWVFSSVNGQHNFDDLRGVSGWSRNNYAIVGTTSGSPGVVGEFIGPNLNWYDVTPAPLYAAWADPAGPLYVAGDDGLWVESQRDGGWVSLGNGLDGGLRALTGCNGAIWLAGQGGAFGAENNTNWAPDPALGTDFAGIWCDPFGVPWAVGTGGYVRTSGGPISTPTTEDLFAISGSDSDLEFFVSGDHGTILRYRRDSGFLQEASGTRRALRGIWVTDGGVTAVGDRNTVLRRAR
jgi:hypothetical protein